MASTKKPSTRITSLQFTKAAAMWKGGHHTLDEIIAALGLPVTKQGLHGLFKRKAIVRGSEPTKSEEELELELLKQAERDAVEKSARIKETKDEHYKLGHAVRRLLAKEIISIAKGDSTPAVSYAAIKSLRLAQDALGMSANHAWLVLGLNKDADADEAMPPLTIKELTAAEIVEIQTSQTDLDPLAPDGLEAAEPTPVDATEELLEDDSVVVET